MGKLIFWRGLISIDFDKNEFYVLIYDLIMINVTIQEFRKKVLYALKYYLLNLNISNYNSHLL